MQWPLNRKHTIGAVVAALAIAATLLWRFDVLGTRGGQRGAGNSIMVIAPYSYQGTWVFDDPAAGLVREPFVAGVPEMIDALVKDIPDANQGFRLLFSASPFPGYQKKLTRVRGDSGGNYYRLEDPPMEGWICPALFKYYDTAPQTIYVRAESKTR